MIERYLDDLPPRKLAPDNSPPILRQLLALNACVFIKGSENPEYFSFFKHE